MKKTKDNSTIQYLNNVTNYEAIFDEKIKVEDILTTFTAIIKEYISVFNMKMPPKQLKNYNFIFVKGFESVVHVFETTLLYTKSIETARHHSQKAIYFFIEFIEQITDEQNSFLQLSCRDATLFVYKKTIFEINNDYKRKFPNLTNKEQELIAKLNVFIKIYKLLVTNKLIDLSFSSELIKKINKLKYNISQTLLDIICMSYDRQYSNNIMLEKLENFLDNCGNKNYIKNVFDTME